MLTFYFSGVEGTMTVPDLLTAGMVGRQVMLEFSPEWESFSKTAVFSNGETTRDVVFAGNPVTIPAEVLQTPLKRLTVGVYGLGDGGKVAIPTVRAEGPVIQPGAEPSGDPALDPTMPIWEQILGQIGSLENLRTINRNCLVGAINELSLHLENGAGGGGGGGIYYTPAVSQEGILSWSNNGGAPNPAPTNIRGPAGEAGYTPLRGTDYWTEADQEEIRSYVEYAILGGIW